LHGSIHHSSILFYQIVLPTFSSHNFTAQKKIIYYEHPKSKFQQPTQVLVVRKYLSHQEQLTHTGKGIKNVLNFAILLLTITYKKRWTLQ
jgi:hypothetical protein